MKVISFTITADVEVNNTHGLTAIAEQCRLAVHRILEAEKRDTSSIVEDFDTRHNRPY
jgi:hypothetical protein